MAVEKRIFLDKTINLNVSEPALPAGEGGGGRGQLFNLLCSAFPAPVPLYLFFEALNV